MLQQRRKRPVFVLCTLLLMTIFSVIFYRAGQETTIFDPAYLENEETKSQSAWPGLENDFTQGDQSAQATKHDASNGDNELDNTMKADDKELQEDPVEYREVFSNATWDRKYVPVFYQGANVINPSIVPHPTEYFLWIIIAQRKQEGIDEPVAEQIACTATFFQGSLFCTTGHAALPVQPSVEGRCVGEYADLNEYSGARNARVFYGPEAPYLLYSSLSQYGCIGVWIQDARTLIQPLYFQHIAGPQLYLTATEVQTPYARKVVEENLFMFWDTENRPYVHHGMFPQRVFAPLRPDGSVGEDLGLHVAMADQICYAKYLPKAAWNPSAVQQATNSLSITLCRRADSSCVPNDTNTFIMHLFNIESTNGDKTTYEPYVVLFERSAPFAIHAISQKPLWIHGRKIIAGSDPTNMQSEAIYITSMNWKMHTQKYHGFIDDLLFLGFGIEESHPGALDVMASDFLQDLAFC